jgi:hypothetical protein
MNFITKLSLMNNENAIYVVINKLIKKRYLILIIININAKEIINLYVNNV